MRSSLHHRWDLSTRSARAEQARLAGAVCLEDAVGTPCTVAGLDVGLPARGQRRTLARAAVVVLSFPALEPLEEVVVDSPLRFPYVPGLLSFREIPPLLAALERLRTDVDLLMCDGQGIAHPRRFGLASHLGVLLDRPSIGVAKSRLTGEAREPGLRRGARSPLILEGDIVGSVLRTRDGVKPLYVSPGHRVSVDTAVELVLACHAGVRLPQPTRLADRLTRRPPPGGG